MVNFLILIFSIIAHAQVVPSGVPSVGYGKNEGDASAQAVVVPANDTSFYSVTCGFGTSVITDGYYYRCYKLDTSGGGTNWALSSGTTARCKGFQSAAGAATLGVTFGIGTAIVTNNSNSAPAGEVLMSGNGISYVWGASSAVPTWHSIPITFTATGSTYYPFMKAYSSASSILNVVLICKDN